MDSDNRAELPEKRILNRYQRLSEIVAQQIVDWIVSGTIKPGQRLVPDDIASKLGVSRSPVRESLRILEEGGFLESAPYRGTWLRQLTVEEIEEIYLLRQMLEGRAVYFAAEQISPEEISQLEYLCRLYDECLHEGELSRLQELNKEFHFTLYFASRRPRLCKLINSLWDSIAYYRVLYAKDRAQNSQLRYEHLAFIEACKARDGKKLERLVREAIKSHAEEMIRVLNRNQSLGSSGRNGGELIDK